MFRDSDGASQRNSGEQAQSFAGREDYPEENEENLEQQPRDPKPAQPGRGRGHVGHTDEELEEMRKYDLRRVKRIMANRSSAARSKVRKLRYTNELDSRISALSNEQRALQEEFYAVQANIAAIGKENDFLCDEIRKLHDDVSKANGQAARLKQTAHALRMQVLNAPLTAPRAPQSAIANFQAATRDAFSLQFPQRQGAAAATEALMPFTSSLSPNMPGMSLEGRVGLPSNLPLPTDGLAQIAQRPPSPFIIPQLWSGISNSSTGSAFSSNTFARPLVADRQLTADDPMLLNMLQSMDLSCDLNTGMKPLPSDVSTQSGMFHTGSSYNPRPSLSQLLSTRSSVGSLQADRSAWNLLSPAAADGSLLPLLEQKQYRRSAGDFPLGLPEPLQGLARYPRHFSEPRSPQNEPNDFHTRQVYSKR